MMRAVETVLFLSLATGVHLGFWAMSPGPDGLPQAGDLGTGPVTLTAAAPRDADLVARWTRPPETAPTPAAPNAPAVTDPALPPAALPLPARAAPAAPPLLPAREALVRPDLTPLPRPAPPQATAPTPPAPPVTKAAPVMSSVPGTRPDPTPPTRPTPPAQAQAPDPATDPARPSQRAAGPVAPQTPAAGSTAGRAEPNAAQTARAQALQADWGARIQRKVHRHLRHPGGTAGQGTARVSLTVNRAGHLTGLRLIRSSGIPAFDQAALAAVHRAGRFPAAPDGLDEASYAFTLSLSFRP